MMIDLTASQAAKILRRFGHGRVPRPGRGVSLAGESGAIEHDRHYGIQWVGTESELIRLSKHLGIIRSTNPRRGGLDVGEWVTLQLPPHKHVRRPRRA